MTMPIVRGMFATVLAGMLAMGPMAPAFAQNALQAPPSAPTPHTQTSMPPVSLGLAQYHFTRAPRPFPKIWAPYQPISVPAPQLTNAPRIEQMIHNGKLEISLQDAIELALQNNVDIAVARYNPWLADTSILKTEAGGFGYGTTGALFANSSANLPALNFDPTLSGTVSFNDASSPVNNPFIAGTGTSQVSSVKSHTSTFNTQYAQGFATGTTMYASWDNTRGSSTSAFNTFNPFVESSINFGFQQQLLNGFGWTINRRNIIISKRNRKIADLVFEQQAITSITNVIDAYWELVYARENVKVEEQAVAVSKKLYNDNQKQLQIGTMAPLDVTRAASELATDQQNLIVAQTAQLQQQQVLMNAIAKDPLAKNLADVEIVPTDQPTPPAAIEAPSFEDSVKEAFAKRPDLKEEVLNLENADLDVKATHRALLPTATLAAQYSTVGLAGNSPLLSAPTTVAGNPVVDAAGAPIIVTDANGNPVPIFVPTTSQSVLGQQQSGLGTAMSQAFHNDFPDYQLSLNIQIPIRNRSAQADNQHAILVQRQLETQMQQLKNSVTLDVRNTYVALVQDRAQVDAAVKASELQQQTFEAEQKKYQLGASTVYNVILTQRDYVAAQGTELRALANLVEAKANYERALGRTLDVNHVSIADALSGGQQPDTLIPGTRDGKVIGTEDLLKDLPSYGEQPGLPSFGDRK
jgi:outer membrane protein